MKLLKVKKQDTRPSIRIKVAGNVFVEVYKDNKGYFYRIDVPGATDFVSKERFENQDKARLAGVTHAKKFIGKVRGDQKKADDAVSSSQRYLDTMKERLESMPRTAKFVVKQMETWPDQNDREDMSHTLSRLRDLAEDAVEALNKAAAELAKKGRFVE